MKRSKLYSKALKIVRKQLYSRPIKGYVSRLQLPQLDKLKDVAEQINLRIRLPRIKRGITYSPESRYIDLSSSLFGFSHRSTMSKLGGTPFIIPKKVYDKFRKSRHIKYNRRRLHEEVIPVRFSYMNKIHPTIARRLQKIDRKHDTLQRITSEDMLDMVKFKGIKAGKKTPKYTKRRDVIINKNLNILDTKTGRRFLRKLAKRKYKKLKPNKIRKIGLDKRDMSSFVREYRKRKFKEKL